MGCSSNAANTRYRADSTGRSEVSEEESIELSRGRRLIVQIAKNSSELSFHDSE